MNFKSDCFIFIILSIILKITSIEGNEDEFEVCQHLPADLEKVSATVYFNGCTDTGNDLFSQICSSKDGFSSDVLSLTLKVGADVTVDDDDYYNCITEGEEYGCTCTFQHACLSQLMDQETFLNFVCCAIKDDRTVEDCALEFGMDQSLKDCMNGETTIDRKKIVLDNAKEILDKGVDLGASSEPFTLFTEYFDNCIDLEAFYWWTRSVCAQFTTDIFHELDNCK